MYCINTFSNAPLRKHSLTYPITHSTTPLCYTLYQWGIGCSSNCHIAFVQSKIPVCFRHMEHTRLDQRCVSQHTLSQYTFINTPSSTHPITIHLLTTHPITTHPITIHLHQHTLSQHTLSQYTFINIPLS